MPPLRIEAKKSILEKKVKALEKYLGIKYYEDEDEIGVYHKVITKLDDDDFEFGEESEEFQKGITPPEN